MIKNTIRIAAALVAIALIGWGASHYTKSKTAATGEHACALDLQALVLPDPEGKLKTEQEIARAMFDHYFSYYYNQPECPGTSLKTARLVSVGKVTRDNPSHFLADITFELQPTSLAETKWISPEVSTSSDGWIRNKQGTLSIQTASSTYFLAI